MASSIVSNAFRRSVPYSQMEKQLAAAKAAEASPMPFGVQSLIPSGVGGVWGSPGAAVSNAFRRSVPYSLIAGG